MTKHQGLAGLAALFAAIIGGALTLTWPDADPGLTTDDQVSSSGESSQPFDSAADLPLAAPEAKERAERVQAASGGDDPTPTSVPESRQSAGLRLRAIDPTTFEDVVGFKLAAHSETRGIVRSWGESPIQLRLTEGSWTVRVQKDGFDELELPGVELRRGETTDLGELFLPKGTGVLYGRVDITSREGIVVTLHGDHQFPCSVHTLAVDPDCGTCKDLQSKAFVSLPKEGGSFEFSGLTEGDYGVTATGFGDASLHAGRVHISRGEAKRYDVEALGRTVRLHVAGPSSTAFTGEWREGQEEIVAPVSFTFFEDDRACAAASFTSNRLGAYQRQAREAAANGPPRDPLFGVARMTKSRLEVATLLYSEDGETEVLVRVADRWDTWVETDWVDSESMEEFESTEGTPWFGSDRHHPLDLPPEDRELQERHKQPMRGDFDLPTPRVRVEPARHLGGGIYEMEDVPPTATLVFVSSGPYHGAVELDLKVSDTSAYYVDLNGKCWIPSVEAAKGQRCTDCHDGMPVFDKTQ